MIPKIAVLSNINLNFIVRMLKAKYEIYEAEGYGNELGLLLDRSSSYHAFAPDITILITDLMEILDHDLSLDSDKIDTWFDMVESSLTDDRLYLIGDAYLWGAELDVVHQKDRKGKLEAIWQERLNGLCEKYTNVQIFPYGHVIEKMGEENAFSLKMWYMGKILHTNEAQKRMYETIVANVELQYRVPKKVLLLDLDNTLWGGLAGETDHTPLILSDDHGGLAYKNLQRVILQMQKQGVLLGIVSKNNEEDAMEIIEKHPHMVLRSDMFAIRKINWEPKHINIMEIAKELNLGMDSFVFWDDNPTERELIKHMLPEVVVPDFPEKPEQLALGMVEIYKTYFQKTALTTEDLDKTNQYAAHAKRNDLERKAIDFESYLEQLKIEISLEEPQANMERFTQMVNKTNQFNLTTVRYTPIELQQVLDNPFKKVYLYRVKDCFGDNGIVAAVIVSLESEALPVIEEFVMSCRVMGKHIEYQIIEQIEQDLAKEGIQGLQGIYIPTAKNKPVEHLYERAGYELVEEKEDGTKILAKTFKI